MRVLVAPDKFKGTLSATDAAGIIARGWRKIRPRDSVEQLPVSDGGEGFGEIVGALLNAKPRRARTMDAAHRPWTATWWWESKSKTAIIESARVIGLAMLPPKTFHPFTLDTFGLGVIFRAAAQAGAKQIIIGIGGSATNDGGFGLAKAMGWRFVLGEESEFPKWKIPLLITEAHPPEKLSLPKIRVAVDVQNPLLGPRGATRVFGTQKGLGAHDLPIAENCLRMLAFIMHRRFGRDFSQIPGAGASGGLGFGLAAFFGARLESGFKLFAHYAKLGHRLRAADLVVTGEGSIDRSTFMGKGVGEIAGLCRRAKIPCIAIAGTLPKRKQVARQFTAIHALTDLTNPEEARFNAALWLERTASTAAASFNHPDSKA